jgi:diketogulonate reductase-like aldo/keto reductase
VKPNVLQNRFYAETGYDVALRAFCAKCEIRYQSFWTLTANPKALASRTLIELAQRYGATVEQVFLRCLTQCDIAPLVGTTSEAHMRQDLALFEFTLTPSEISSVMALLPSG